MKKLTIAEENQNGYICFFQDKKVEVYARTSYEAQQKAVDKFKALGFKRVPRQSIVVKVAEIDGKPVIHNPAEL